MRTPHQKPRESPESYPTKVMKCPSSGCTQQLRVPDVDRYLHIRCPKCKGKFFLAPEGPTKKPVLDPDYGMHLLSSGWSQMNSICLLNVRINHIQFIGTGRYRAHMSRTTSGKRYAITYDFDEEILHAIRELSPTHIRSLIDAGMNTKASPEAQHIIVEFHEMIPITGFYCHLGEVEHAEHEDYVPLRVDRIVQEEDTPNKTMDSDGE